MGQRHAEIPDKLKKFIEDQKIFFVGTAAVGGRVNISPKGMDSLKIVGKNRVVWLNVTGSGNETSAHVQEDSRMTLMVAAFEGNPMILRLYGHAKVIHQQDPEWQELFALFDPLPGARQIFDLSVDLVQTSCGMAVPFFNYIGEREQLNDWATKKGDQGIREYWGEKNRTGQVSTGSQRISWRKMSRNHIRQVWSAKIQATLGTKLYSWCNPPRIG